MGYPTDMTYKEWGLIKHHFSKGRRRKYDKRVLMNAVLYLVKTGCQWRMPPNDFPPCQTVILSIAVLVLMGHGIL